jgi:hypothetical protein
MLSDGPGITLVPSLEVARYKRGGFNFFHEIRRYAGEKG